MMVVCQSYLILILQNPKRRNKDSKDALNEAEKEFGKELLLGRILA